jgi:hypothetical protein
LQLTAPQPSSFSLRFDKQVLYLQQTIPLRNILFLRSDKVIPGLR